MVKVRREFVFATFLTSGIAVILSIVALGTQYWVTSDVKIDTEITTRMSSVHYGLFGGIYERAVGNTNPPSFELSMTCVDGLCAMLCDPASGDRAKTLRQLLDGKDVAFDCISMRGFLTHGGTRRHSVRAEGNLQDRSISAGLWITTILFLVISCLFGVFSTVLAMWNTVYNPVEVYFNITGLFVCNCIACGFSVLTLVMWGSQFATTLVKNVCVFDTIKGDATSDGYALLGFSYWMNLVSFLLYAASLILLGVRQHLINKQQPMKVELEDNNDPGLILY